MSVTSAAPRPSLWQSIFEFRALFEVMSMAPAKPLLDLAPTGDGQPVLVFPGFFAADGSTARLRKYLNKKGFKAYAWEQGRNPGLSEELYYKLEARVQELAAEHGGKVSLVGWSLGGLYARILAHRLPDQVRQVVTLGSPFNISQMGSVSGAVERLYERMNPNQQNDPLLAHEAQWQQPPPVPSTAIYSEGDGVAHWSFCIDPEDALTENLHVPSSHLGMTHNPLILYALADRLAQAEGDWQPFRWLPRLKQTLLQNSRRLLH
jgi:pimeloyl-ACP methyl ester carboxylesterase